MREETGAALRGTEPMPLEESAASVRQGVDVDDNNFGKVSDDDEGEGAVLNGIEPMLVEESAASMRQGDDDDDSNFGKVSDDEDVAGGDDAQGPIFPRRRRQEAWRRFTPERIDGARCMARTWGVKGAGGQCLGKAVAGKTLCSSHAASGVSHGLVTGPIPYGKLQLFLAAERRRVLGAREHADVVSAARDEAAVDTGAGARKRQRAEGKPRPQQRWYTRAMMWEMALKVDTATWCARVAQARYGASKQR
jgi:hypothetical protein